MKKTRVTTLTIGIFVSLMLLNSTSAIYNVIAIPIADVTVNIDTNLERAPISPYIYGANQDFANAKVTARRIGGNRLTGYNWENNFSNAGSDYLHSNDTYLSSYYNVSKDKLNESGSVVTTFHDKSLKDSVPYSLVTLQAAGYVSADGNGAVLETEKAPSTRWKEVKFTKNSPLSLTPDKNDNYVYIDEFVNSLVDKYGKASSITGIKGYSIDNESALWSNNHPRIHPSQPLCYEIVDKSINLSKAVKAIDSSAEVFGPAMYGFGEFAAYQAYTASDWSSVKGNYKWFIDYYLDNIKKASTTEGKRLVDVLDLHWYPEATGGEKRIVFDKFDASNIDCNKARLQAPRALWDSKYIENSWVAQYSTLAFPLIPNIQSAINNYNPGTKLAFTEYSYGGENHITGGIAEADVLGIMGTQGVYLSSFWKCENDSNYVQAAFNLYTNYDGNGSKYGDTKVKCSTSDTENSSAYTSIVKSDDNKLHIVVLNKNYDSSVNFNFNMNSNNNYVSGKVWGFDQSSSIVTARTDITNISNNKFTYTVEPLTALHIVLDINKASIIYGDLNNDKVLNITDYVLMKRYISNPNSNITVTVADLNGDGSVTALDSTLLKQYLLRKTAKFPIEN